MKTIYLTVGAPACGKSTFVKSYISAFPQENSYLSSDELRAVFGKDETDQSVSYQVFSHIFEEVEKFLQDESKQGYLIVDATNINIRLRRQCVSLAKEYNARIIAWVFERDREILIENNKSRSRIVPLWVIDRMLELYKRPTEDEGFDGIVDVLPIHTEALFFFSFLSDKKVN